MPTPVESIVCLRPNVETPRDLRLILHMHQTSADRPLCRFDGSWRSDAPSKVMMPESLVVSHQYRKESVQAA